MERIVILFFISGGTTPCTVSASFNSYVDSNSTSHFSNTTSGGGSYAYSWSFGDGTYSSLENPSHFYSSPGTYYACLTAYDLIDSLCSDTYCDTIFVTGGTTPCTVSASFNSYVDSIFANNFNFSNTTSGGGSYAYSWSFGDGTYSSLENPSHAYASMGTYTVCLTVYDLIDSLCSDTYCSTVTFSGSTPCTVSASFSSYVDSNSTSYFTNTTSGGGSYAYSWNFGDGTYSWIENPSHFYSSPGTYTVCLTVYDLTDTTCSDVYCNTIYVSGNTTPCTVSASFSSYVDSNSTSYFTNTTSGGGSYAYSWSFGDGTYSSLENPSHFYSSQGTYYVCLTVYDLIDSLCSDTYCDTIFVSGNTTPCTVSASFSSYVDSNSTSYFTNTTSGGGSYAYSWSFGDGTYSSLENPSHFYSNPGSYTVCLTVYDLIDSLCSDTYCNTIYVSGGIVPCTVSASFSSYVDSNSTSYFTNTTSGGGSYAYSWSFGDGTYSSLENPSHFYASGTYYVCLIVYDLVDTTCSDTYCDTIFVSGSTAPCTVSASFSSYVDSNSTSYFTNTTSGGGSYAYSWSFGDGTYSSLENPSHFYSSQGTYYVCLTVYDLIDSLCSDTYCDTILVLGSTTPCTVSASFSSYVDSNSTSYFTNTTSGGGSYAYSWSFGDGNTSSLENPSHSYSSAGTYNVCLTVYDLIDSLCSDTYCTNVAVLSGSDDIDSLGGSNLNSLNTKIIDASLSIYPNPAKENINIDFNGEQANVLIYNSLGSVVLEKLINKNENNISTVHLETGIYIVTLKTENGINRSKLIIE